LAKPELLNVRWPEKLFPIRDEGVVEVNPLLPIAPMRLLTAFLGVEPRTEGGPAPWKFATLRLCAAILWLAKVGPEWLPKKLPPLWVAWNEPLWAKEPSWKLPLWKLPL